MSVKFKPQGPVAEVNLRFTGHEPGLSGGKLVESRSLVRVSILLRVRVARGRVALRRRVAQQTVVGSVRDHRMVSHVAARAADGESWVRRSMLTRVGKHGGGTRLNLTGLRQEIPFSCRSIESVTTVGDSVKIRREFASLDVPWWVLRVGEIVCLWLIRHPSGVFFQRWTSLQVVADRYNRVVLQGELRCLWVWVATAHNHTFLGARESWRDATLELHRSMTNSN